MTAPRIISYGGGVQSTALVVLAALRDPALEEALGGAVDAAVMANVGDDSEHPATVAYVRDVVTPWAADRGLEVVEVRRQRRDGSTPTLLEELVDPNRRTIGIPVRMDSGAPVRRSCTADFKIRPIARWLREHGATRDDPATVAIGISTDEVGRIGSRRDAPYERAVYPLIDLRLDRTDCRNIVTRAGLPAPGKSACWFCPYTRPNQWAEMRRDDPELFGRAVELERALGEKRDALISDGVGLNGGAWLSGAGAPLDEAHPAAQNTLPGFEPDSVGDIGAGGCDSGHCFT